MKTLTYLIACISTLMFFSAAALAQENAMLTEAEGLFAQEKFVEAGKLFRQLVEQDNKDFNANFKLGLCELTQRNYSDAVVMLTAASELEGDPQHEVYFYRAFSYWRLNKDTEALADYTRAIEIKPDYIDAFNNRAQVYEKQENHRAAIQDYQSALAIDSTNPGLWYNVGRLFAGIGNCREAVQAFNTALQYSPDYPEVLMQRGNCHLLLKLLDRSLADFKHLVEVQPDNAEALAKLGYCQALSGDTEQGCANLRRSTELGFEGAADMSSEVCK